MKRRALLVGRTRYAWPVPPEKFDALRSELDIRVLGTSADGTAHSDSTFTLVRRLPVLDGLLFWLALPGRISRLVRDFRPDAIVCQTAYEGAAALLARRIARVPARVVIEVHGDWRTATRLYGSPARRAISRVADAVAAAAIRRADRVRTVSPFTASLVRELGVEPAADFPAYMDLESFTRPPVPLPARPVALFVGVLEPYKNVGGLAEAWGKVEVDADLRIVGKGSREQVVRELGVRWDRELSHEEIAQALDEAWILVLPSRSEGMGRVLVEAFLRGRGVIGSRAGSIPNLVEDGVSGVLVGSTDELAGALARVLSDRALAERLGHAARDAAEPWLQTPQQYAQRMRELVRVRVVFVTQAADPAHPVLGATVAKIRALAARCEEVVVLADRVDERALPENVRARSFAAPSQAARGARYLAALAPELLQRPVAVVAHMAPVYALLAAPLARPLRVPLLLWFTQQGAGPALRNAERVVDVVLTVDRRTVPLVSPKVRAIGHGIDVDAIPCVPERRPPLRRLLGLGRYAPVKGWETAVRALVELPDATLTLHGPQLTDADRAYRPQLVRLADELGVAERVTFGDDVAYAHVPQLLGLADALVNPTHGNAADKVVYEAAAACLPVFAASPVFDTLLPEGLRFHGDYPSSLAEKIRDYAGGAGPELRERVRAEHSVEHWAERVLEAAGG